MPYNGFTQQENKNNAAVQYIHRKFKFTAGSFLINSLDFKNYGNQLLHSKPVTGFEAAISYYEPLSPTLGINLGVGAGIMPYNINYDFDVSATDHFLYGRDLNLNSNIYFIQDYFLSFSIQKYFNLKPTIFLNAEIGLKNHYIPEFFTSTNYFYEIDENNPDFQLFEFNLYSTVEKNKAKEKFFSYFLKFGIAKKVKRRSLFELNLYANYTHKPIGWGYYRFYDLPRESGGNAYLKMRYIGIQMVYGLNFVKKQKIKQ